MNITESVNFLFVPIMNVQGYLRQSPNGRINQHGPNTSGRRSNGSFKNASKYIAAIVLIFLGTMRSLLILFLASRVHAASPIIVS